MRKKQPAIFLDRDGTILNERGYLADPRDMRFYSFSFKALRALRASGYKLIVITNQSGVGRGYFNLKQLARVHEAFKRRLRRKGVLIDGIYFCPHRPDAGCRCRKPKPFLINKAIRERQLDRAGSFMVGDQERDLKLGRAAKVKPLLVLTGAGRQVKARQGAHVAANLLHASRWILERHGK